MTTRPANDLVEIFGYAPDDLSPAARTLWALSACPFVSKPCSKSNHDGSVIYGTCSVTTSYGDCIICPNRLYDRGYASLRLVAAEAFDGRTKFMMFDEYIAKRSTVADCVVALGRNSGREVNLGRKMSMDWVLARITRGRLIEYTGVEVQSIDITGNYRDTWHAYKNISPRTKSIPTSKHGLNWANVHKRLIPQLIRKGLMYSRSTLVRHGLFFVVPEIVYKKFEEVLGYDLPVVTRSGKDVLTIHTYELTPYQRPGVQREAIVKRKIRVPLADFAERFVSGPSLPPAQELDLAIRRVLALE
jgi:hypothetical protein